jgi:hypothetical protein
MSTTDRDNLLPHLQQALSMLDLSPEDELNRYRRYKKGELDAVRTFESAELIERPGGVGALNRAFTAPVKTTEEEEDEEYEMIPPSQSFAVYDNKNNDPSTSIQSTDLDNDINDIPAGEMVLSGQVPENDSLNLSVRTPGTITPREEYLPASQDLINSLGEVTPPTEIQIPKWKMPVAIGSSLMAIAALGGMSYVNMHPTLLKSVPGVAQLTASPVLPVVPPGQVLQGPDLAMGEFSDLSLSNINSLTMPGTEIAKTGNPNLPAAIAPTSSPISAALPQSTLPNPAIATTAPSPTAHLADGLIRNLLPPSIQQLSGQPSPATNPTVDQYYYRPPAAATTATAGYTVFAQSRNPRSFAKIQSLVPKATVQGDRVFLGNFPSQSAADGFVKQMQDQGIKAWSVKP